MEIVIGIVIAIVVAVMEPVQRAIYGRIRRRWVAYIVTFLTALALTAFLFLIAALCGFDVTKRN